MNWPKVQLQAIALHEKGAIVSGPFGSNISAKYFVEEGVPVIRGNNRTKGITKFIDEGFAYLTEAKPESTEGGRRVSILKWPEGALLNLG